MAFLERLCRRLATLLAVVSSVGLAVLVVLLAIDLFGRNFLGFTTTFANEWSAFVNGAVILLAAPLAFLKDDLIRVEALALLKSRALRTALGLLASVVGFAVALYLAYAIGATAWESFATDRRSTWVLRTPLWIPQAALALGAAVLALAALHHLLAELAALRSRRKP